MHHVPRAGNGDQAAPRQIPVQALGVAAHAHVAILCAGDDDRGYFELRIFPRMWAVSGRSIALSSPTARSCSGRSASQVGNLEK